MMCAIFFGRNFFIIFAILSLFGKAAIYVGDLCSIVIFSTSSAIVGTIVTAVAPLPITTTFLFL